MPDTVFSRQTHNTTQHNTTQHPFNNTAEKQKGSFRAALLVIGCDCYQFRIFLKSYSAGSATYFLAAS